MTVYDLANCNSATQTFSSSGGVDGDRSVKEFGKEELAGAAAAAGSSSGNDEDDEFTVVLAIASDGVWDVISPRQCAAMMDER